MITTITVNNDLSLFYNNFRSIISKMFPSYNVNLTTISSTINYISITDVSSRVVIDMYAVNLLPESILEEQQEIILCNNITVTNGAIDFTNFSIDNIGPCVYTYDSNNHRTSNTFWITNTNASDMYFEFNEGEIDNTTFYRYLYNFSFSRLVLPTNDYQQIEYITLGFQSRNESVPLFYISKTNLNNIGVFGIVDSVPTNSSTYVKFITTYSNAPATYNLENLCVNSSIISLSAMPIPQSINHEYLPYLFYCIGTQPVLTSYMQLEPNGMEFLPGFNNLFAMTSNPKFTLYQQIIYSINIFDSNNYTINTIKLIDNTDKVIIDWGDNSPITTINAGSSAIPTHYYTSGGNYNITFSYVSLTNPNNLSNIAEIDNYTTSVSFANADQLDNLDVTDMFKNSDPFFDSILSTVVLPPNITSMYSDGFCENCLSLVNVTFPTVNCNIIGQWLYNSAWEEGSFETFTYPANVTFLKNEDNIENNFYTGNFSDTIIVDSDVECDTLYIGDYVTTLTLNGNIDCIAVTSELDSNESNNSTLTTLNINDSCNFNTTSISNLPNLTTINIDDASATTVIYDLNNLDSLTSLNVTENLTAINSITYCNSLTSIGIPETVTTVGDTVGLYCDNFEEFIVDDNNDSFFADYGILYSKDGTALLNVPYGYTDTDIFDIPVNVTAIGSKALTTHNAYTTLNILSNVQNLNNDFMYQCNINTLNIDSNILSNSEFSTATVGNLILGSNVTSLNTGIFSNVNITSLTVNDENIILNTNQFNMSALTVIKGYVGSTAETFANANNIRFIPLSFGTNQTKYYITVPDDNYVLAQICSLTDSYSLIDWGDGSEEVIYNLDTSITHTFETSGNYTVTITHIAPETLNFSYTNSNIGLFQLAYKLDFSSITLCSNVVTSAFNNLTDLQEIVFPPNIVQLENILQGCTALTDVTLPTALSILRNSFNSTYTNLSDVSLPNGLTEITNCFNNTNILPNSLTINSSSNLTIASSFNNCSNTTSLVVGEKVVSISNSFMNLLNLVTLTCDSNNANYSSNSNLLLNKTATSLVLVPGGLNSITIPASITALLQGSIANNKTYSHITIPAAVTTINYPFYNSSDETKVTSITTLEVLNPYLSLVNIDKINTIVEQGITTYYDTAAITNLIGYEHSVVHSQSDGYNRYVNCSAYNFTSLGYYNSNIVIGSDYTDTSLTNNQLLTISDTMINNFNNYFSYNVPDKNVYNTIPALITEVSTNVYDFITNNYPYVIFYNINSTTYEYRIYVFDNSVANTSITINDAGSMYNSLLITIDYNTLTHTFSNSSAQSNFNSQVIDSNGYDSLYVYQLELLENDAVVTPVMFSYSTFIKQTLNEFIGYVIGSNNTGTNKLFIGNSIIRVDDYWLNAEVDEINADNIVHICSYSIDSAGNVGSLVDATSTSISETLSYLKLIRTDKYMFENNVELVSPIYEITP